MNDFSVSCFGRQIAAQGFNFLQSKFLTNSTVTREYAAGENYYSYSRQFLTTNLSFEDNKQ